MAGKYSSIHGLIHGGDGDKIIMKINNYTGTQTAILFAEIGSSSFGGNRKTYFKIEITKTGNVTLSPTGNHNDSPTEFPPSFNYKWAI